MWGKWIALVLSVLTGTVAIFSIWANDQLLDTGSWVKVSGNLLESQQVRHRVAEFLGEELTAQTEAQLDAAGQEGIASVVLPRLRAEQVALAEKVMKTKRFHRVWAQANRSGHQALLRVLNEEAGTEGGVVVDLTPALRQVAEELGETGLAEELGVSELGSLVEPGAARIKVLESQELSVAQDAVRVVRHLTLPAVLLTIFFWALAFVLGRRRLTTAFLGFGVALAATGALTLLVRSLAGHEVIDQLVSASTDRSAAEAAWGVITSKVSDLAGIAIGLGAVVVLLTGAAAVVRKMGFGGEREWA
jgi:hypothetical protein